MSAAESNREVVIPKPRVASPRRWTGLEKMLRQRYGEMLAGVDEVGRDDVDHGVEAGGCLARALHDRTGALPRGVEQRPGRRRIDSATGLHEIDKRQAERDRDRGDQHRIN